MRSRSLNCNIAGLIGERPLFLELDRDVFLSPGTVCEYYSL
jgi:hypothetical protein